jgi:UDP-N-acetylmuramate: L-alanyl-gamma-D-glutamyl-meso-diaminopimelate ligase
MNQLGRHNASNAMAAMAAARHAGVSLEVSIEAMRTFTGVKRRLENKGTYKGITIYDDFAHHPTEIECALEAVCDHSPDKRVVVIFEPRSNTMQMGVHADSLSKALARASKSFVYDSGDLDWSLSSALGDVECIIQKNIDDLIVQVLAYLNTDDVVLILSNGGFGGLCSKLINKLQ